MTGVSVADDGATGAFLQILAERASADPAYLAWVMRTHTEAEGRSTADVVAQLGVAEDLAPDFLVSLRPTGERFANMLSAICDRFGADERALLAVLREAEVIDAFLARTPPNSGATDSGLLMAARMREKESRPSGVANGTEARPDVEQGGEGGSDAR